MTTKEPLCSVSAGCHDLAAQAFEHAGKLTVPLLNGKYRETSGELSRRGLSVGADQAARSEDLGAPMLQPHGPGFSMPLQHSTWHDPWGPWTGPSMARGRRA